MIYFPVAEEDKIGGGWTFLRNFKKGLIKNNVSFTHNIDDDWDICFCPGATMTKREDWDKARHLAKDKGRKMLLRIDGIPEDWRNRGTGWPRLKQYSEEADIRVFQSTFSKNTVGKILGIDGEIILNGIDTTIFRSDGDKLPAFGNPSILFCNFRKGEHNKRVEEAIFRFRLLKKLASNATITFVGDFSKEQFLWDGINWDFGMLDLEQGKDWQYLGIIKDEKRLSRVMRSCTYIAFPSFADPCPNTLIEAISCGCEPLWVNEYGGQDEISLLRHFDWSLERMTKQYLNLL